MFLLRPLARVRVQHVQHVQQLAQFGTTQRLWAVSDDREERGGRAETRIQKRMRKQLYKMMPEVETTVPNFGNTDLDVEVEKPPDNDYYDDDPGPPEKLNNPFFDDEDNPEVPDPEQEDDDITSLAHSELEQHRELREFYRVIAWDMPLLWNHRKPYQPPTVPIRFRYTSYMGEVHPAAKKVVMEFTPSDLLKDADKLIKLLGVRYNPETNKAKMSCELYPTAAQNKRWLGDMLDKLLKEAQTGDDFKDLPFDFRHRRVKRQTPKFPDEWRRKSTLVK